MKNTKTHMTNKETIKSINFWFLLFMVFASMQVNAQFVWETRSPFSDTRAPGGIEGAAAAIIGGTVYVSHGFRGGSDTNLLSSYDIATDTWTHGGAGLPDAPGATQSEMGGGTVNGIFYAMAGRNGPVSDTRAFDPATSTWASLTPMPTARGAPGFASLNGLLYAIGGRDGTTIGTGNILTSNEAYDPVTDTWTVLAPLPIAVSDNYATVAINNKIYVFGGSTGGGLAGPATNVGQIYDPITDTWRNGAPMPTARKAHMAAEICGKVAVFGGVVAGSVNTDVTEIYDPVTNTWTAGPALPSPASEIAQGVVGNGKEAYLIGSGFFGAGEPFVFAMVAATDITVTVDDGNVNVSPGDNITYTITINNAGTVDAPGLLVTDNFPAELGAITWTCVAAGGATCTAAGSGNIADTINLPAASTATYTVNATVVGMMNGSFDNMAVATTTIGCFSDATDTDNLVVPSADLSITKTDSVDPVIAGNNLLYTITVDNAGPDDATNVVVTDTLPAGVSFVSSTGCVEDPAGVPNCSLGNIVSGGSANYTVTVSVDAATTAPLTNNVSVTSATNDPNAANNSTSEPTAVIGSADLSISKVDDVDPVVAGSNLVYTITVNNAGPSDAQNVLVTEVLPAGVSFVSSTGCVEDPAGVPNCSLGTIASGGSAAYTVTVSVGAATTGTITNNVSVSSTTADPNAANNSTSEPTAISVQADLSITKTDSVDPVIAGNNLTYTITVDNAGPSDAQSVVVTETLPAGVTFVSSTGCVEDPAGVPTCSLGAIVSGGSAVYTVTVNVDANNTSGSISNSVAVSSSTADPDGTNNSTIEPTTVISDADLSISKIDDVDPVIAGNNLVYTVSVSNAGPSDAQNVVVTDTLPAGVTFVSSSGCVEDPAGVPGCSLGNIAAGGNASYTVIVSVDANTTGTITNNASVSSATTDSNAANDSTSENTQVSADADLSINKVDDVDPVTAGNNLTYTLTVNNAGPSDAQNVVVTDTLPAGVTFVSSAGCTEDPAGVPSCSLGNIAAGGSAAYTVTVGVDASTTGTITNNASVSSSTADSNAANNSTTEDTTISAEADLSITKVDDVDPVVAGNNVVYTITVDNAGPGDAQNVVVTDTLPAGVTFVSSTGCVEDPTGVPSCSLGTIASGANASYTVTVSVDANTTGTISNVASVTSSTTDPNPANDSTTEDTTIDTQADLSISKVDDIDPVVAGNNLVYTITVDNAGPSDAQNVTVNDALPAGVTFVSSAGCSEDPSGVPTCSLGTIAAGASAAYTVTVSVDSDRTAMLTNTASVSSTTTDPNAGNDSTTEDTAISIDTDLTIGITDDVDPVLAGDDLVYTVSVANAGPSDALNVTVTETLPAGVSFTTSSGCVEDPGGDPTCSLGTVVSGGSATFTITVNVDPSTSGTITNVVDVTTSSTESNTSNNNATEDTGINIGADLVLNKQAVVTGPVVVGDVFDYILTVTNNGPSNAVGVVVTDNLPASLTLVSTTGCAEDPVGVPSCTLTDLAPLETAQYTVSVMVQPSGSVSIINTANVDSQTNDSDPDNNVSVATGVAVLITIPTLQWFGLLLLIGMLMYMGIKKFRLRNLS